VAKKKGGFEYKDFLELSKGTKELTQQFDTWVYNFLLTEALRALKLTREASPVDTGTLRRMWSITGVVRNGNTLTVYLVNIMEYASFMEEGFTVHSKKGDYWWEGYHTAEWAVSQIMELVPKRFEAQFEKLLESLGWR
jgi:hypothetical protein